MLSTDGIQDHFPDELLQKKLMRNGFWMYFFAFLIAPTGYLIKIMIAGTLSVEQIGLFYSVLGIISILAAYNDLGLTEALQYYLPHYLIDKKYNESKSIFVYTLILQLVSGILIGSGLFFGAEWLSIHYFKNISTLPLLEFFSLYFILLNISQALNSFFIATQQVKRSQGLEAIRMRTVVVGTGALLVGGYLSLTTFTLLWIGGVIVACLIGFLGLHKLFGGLFTQGKILWDKELFDKQRKYGIWVMIGAGTGTLFGQINQQFALYYLGAQAAGYWSYYLSFYTIVGIVTNPLINYLFPLLNELYKKGHQSKIDHLFKLLFIGIVIFGVVGGIAGYFLAQPIAVLLFGEQFRQSGALFQHYAPFLFTIPLFGILFQDIASRGLVKQRVWILALGLLANTIASFILGHKFGLTGLVYAQLIGNIVLIIGGWYYFRKKK
ncbi:hypothetical protein XF24_00854 [candidate division SR1 bacterium Aalborg_AAW-1]|nr:hypothetical protein XF24_00854 [candidate division SR1 bacterium Aalborg_AAW-1]